MRTTELNRPTFAELLASRISGLEHQTWPEEVLHSEWKKIEEAAHELLESPWQPQWDYAIPDWPANIPLFNWTLNNRKLCNAITLTDVHDCLSNLTLDWHIRLECYDMIRGNQMVSGDDLAEALITRNAGWHWNSPEFAFKSNESERSSS